MNVSRSTTIARNKLAYWYAVAKDFGEITVWFLCSGIPGPEQTPLEKPWQLSGLFSLLLPNTAKLE